MMDAPAAGSALQRAPQTAAHSTASATRLSRRRLRRAGADAPEWQSTALPPSCLDRAEGFALLSGVKSDDSRQAQARRTQHMAEKWDKQLMDFLKRTGEELKRTGDELRGGGPAPPQGGAATPPSRPR